MRRGAKPTKKAKYAAVLRRETKYDGVFYFAIKTTGIYCLPSCPAPRQLQGDLEFYSSDSSAAKHGYRPCSHCRPHSFRITTPLRALAGIGSGIINEKGVGGLARSLKISDRHLRRIVKAATGLSPLQLNQTQRLYTAQSLLQKTKLPIIDVAFRCDFASVRQFNSAFKRTFNITPREMRKNFVTQHQTQ